MIVDAELNKTLESLEVPAQVPRRTHGKIAALPQALRTFVNESIRAGLPYPEIITRLEAQGISGITGHNLSYWYQTAYQHWLEETERIESLRLNSEINLSVAGTLDDSQKNSFNDFGKILIDSQIMQVLQKFDVQRLTELLADHPEKYFALASILNNRSRERLRADKLEFEFQKYRDHVAEQKRQLEQALQPNPGGISPETIAKIRKAINAM